ncbi:hypothetical protein N7462_007296 [Penicillium macrosclerotiorum]|uniref:uncharacterized protein n=1 Tax=Penicillium macrosclerotiorum TaxID=303699 RepID=UPI0025490FEA|nr:uncharacterized protein N7462_007296 [Penicillium macrosclerotiorum]KAJ5679052.1 hypothetical protein N7462_007296 [Penicillium macrosclerotiorum]
MTAKIWSSQCTAGNLHPQATSSPSIRIDEDEFWNAFTNIGPMDLFSPEAFTAGVYLPGFIQPLPVAMNIETIERLRVNGALSLPSIRLQSVLLQTFVESVLPSMPILEWQTFLNAIHDGCGDQGSISLLLFHAVMFSATAFVDMEHLLEAGFSSRQEAHEAFFQRTKLLYQANYEADPLVMVQALLLMTYRLDTTDGHDSHHWIRAAITMARSIGLFQDLSVTINFQHSPRLWKRIAWSCYMTDSLVALRLRCRPSIEKGEFMHSILEESDFEINCLAPENQILSPECSLVRNLKAQRDLALVCISNARLCTCISEVLHLQGKNSRIGASVSPTSPGMSPKDDCTVRTYASEMELADWANSLPPPCQACPAEPHSINEEPAVILHRNILHMVFYTTIAVFHQSKPFSSSRSCVRLAANQISRITSELYQRDLHHRIPVIGVTGILVALIIQISEMKAPPSLEREEAIQNFQLCLQVMTGLRELYWEASRATSWALKVFQNVTFDSQPDHSNRFRERSSSSDISLTDSLIPEVPLTQVPSMN